jgi:hypothetical protein
MHAGFCQHAPRERRRGALYITASLTQTKVTIRAESVVQRTVPAADPGIGWSYGAPLGRHDLTRRRSERMQNSGFVVPSQDEWIKAGNFQSMGERR